MRHLGNGMKVLVVTPAVLAALAACGGGSGEGLDANGQALAAGGLGPRASVSVATVCSLDKTTANFSVELRVKDKTSGSAVPVVTEYSIAALAKTDAGNWSNQTKFSEVREQFASPYRPVPTTISASFSLCTGKDINPTIFDAKGLNAMASTTYASSNGSDPRTVMNMCSDDLDTLDVVEPAGIKLTANDINDISNACKAKPTS